MRPKRRPSSRRSAPSASAATRGWSATKSSRSPSAARSSPTAAATRSSPRNLAIGERMRAVLDEAPRHRLAAVALDDLVEPLELRARHLARAGVERAHRAAAAEDRLEDLELAAAQRLGDVDDLEVEAPVGAVRAEAQHRLVEGHARPRRRPARRSRRPAKTAPITASIVVQDVVLVDEGHLDVELGELELAIGAQVLVAEAARDLVVALVAAHHQQLLEELRRLRQRVPGAGLQAAGDEEVARALGRGAREDRRLDLQEVALVEDVAHGGDDLVAQLHRLAHVLAAQVDHPVLQADHLVDRRVLVDGERRRLAGGQALSERTWISISPVARFGLTFSGARLTISPSAEMTCSGRRSSATAKASPRRMDDELHEPGAVAQVDEDQPAVVAAAMDPAGHPHRVADARGAQVAGPGVAVAVGCRGCFIADGVP